ncbi:hypothetical protein OAK01_00145 [Candidatus Nitrosopelagicus sp.]|nr:hypothetical protein [Candidatus Nitrosopelagicus sp.]
MSEDNFAGNIIVNLASLPDFLRTPILKKRMLEFFSMNNSEKEEIIINALEAGHTIPFPNFAKLFKTWLEVLSTVTEKERYDMFSNYFKQIIKDPQKIILFNLDGIFEIFLSLKLDQQGILIKSIKNTYDSLDEESRRRMILLTPGNSKKLFGF